jgi:DNA-binding CsgD family transcriptional regulator
MSKPGLKKKATALKARERSMTVKEVAEVPGISPETVRANGKVLFPEKFVKGVVTYLNEQQMAAIVEALKAEPGSGKTMTVREVAESLGCNSETIKGHIREIWPGLMQNGKITYLNEAQVTVILEKMKTANSRYDSSSRNPAYNNIVAGAETSLSKEFRLAMLYKKDAEIMKEAASLERELRITAEKRLVETEAAYGREVLEHQGTRTLLSERETGLETIQRIAEAGGLLLSDKEDREHLYKRGRRQS